MTEYEADIDCEHDWRVNPNLILTSNPPRRQIICVDCGAVSSIAVVYRRDSRNPRDWEKYNGTV